MSNAYTVRKYYADGSSEPVREEVVIQDFNRPPQPALPSDKGKDSLGITNTDDLPEGKQNLYYNQERVKSLVLSLLNGRQDGTLDVQTLLDSKASVEALTELQVAVSKMQQAVSAVLSKSNGSASDFNAAVLELKKELASKVSSSEFIKLLATRVTIQDLEDALKPYATSSRVGLLSDRVNKQELRLKALESTEDAHSTSSLLELINQRVSKDELKESLAAYSALLGNIQNGLSGYATTSYVRSEIERTRIDPSRFATTADVETLGKAFDSKLKEASKTITDSLSVDTGNLITHESFNIRVNQEVTKINEKIGELATKKQVESIIPLLEPATPTKQGLMSPLDKEKLENLPVPRSIALKDDLTAVSKRVSVLESSGLDTSKFVTRTDLDLLTEDLRASNKKADLSAYALSSDVNGKFAQIADRVTTLETKADSPVDLSSLVTVQTFNALANKVNAISVPTLPDFSSFASAIKVDEVDKSVLTLKKDVETNYLGKQAFRTEIDNVQDAVAQQIKGLSSRMDRLSTTIRMLPSGDISVDRSAVTDEQLEGKLASIRAELKSLASGLETKSNALQQVNQSVYRRLDAATSAAVALEQRVSEIALANAEQSGKLDLLKASLAKLPDAGVVSEVTRRVSAVETKVDAIRVPSIEAMETQVGVHSAELMSVRNQVREIQTVMPTEAKPTNDTLVSHGAMKKYVSAAMVDSLSPSATRTSAGLVRLATQAEVHSRTGSSVPTVSDVSTMLTNLTIASNKVNGLMTPAMLYALEQAATKRELSEESSKLNDTIVNRLTQQNRRIDSIGKEQSNLRVRVATLEGASGIDPTVFATKTDYNFLREELERVSKFDRLTHDDLEDAKTLLVKGYENKVKELDTKVSSELSKLSDAVANHTANSGTTETPAVNTANFVTKRELALTAAEIRSEFPRISVDRLVTTDVFADTIKTKVDPLAIKVDFLQQELSRKVGVTEFNDYKQSVPNTLGGNVDTTVYAKKEALDETRKQVASLVKAFGTIEDVKALVKVDELVTSCSNTLSEANKAADDKIKPVADRLTEVESRVTLIGAASQSPDLSSYAKASAVEEVKSELASYRDTLATKEELKGYATKEELKTLSTPVSTEGLATKEELNGYARSEALNALATKEELSGYARAESLNTLATKDELTTLATKEELNGYVRTDTLSTIATKEEVSANKPTVAKAQLTDGEAHTLDLSAFVGKIIRLAAVLENGSDSSITLTRATLTLGDQEVVLENKELGSHKHMVFEPKVFVPYSDTAYSVSITGSTASLTTIVEVLA